MLRTPAIAITGTIISVAGVAFFGYTSWLASKTGILEISEVSMGYCAHPLARVEVKRLVFAETESETIFAYLRHDGQKRFPTNYNPHGPLSKSTTGETVDCEVKVSLFAPSFEYEPKESDRTIRLPSNQDIVKTGWVVSPKKPGQQVLLVSSGLDSAEVHIEVVSALGLTIQQATLLSYLAAFLGSAVSLPWWLERAKEWQGKKKTEDSELDLDSKQ